MFRKFLLAVSLMVLVAQPALAARIPNQSEKDAFKQSQAARSGICVAMMLGMNQAFSGSASEQDWKDTASAAKVCLHAVRDETHDIAPTRVPEFFLILTCTQINNHWSPIQACDGVPHA